MKHLTKKILNNKGFSLLEILLVITIIGFLVILIASLPNAMGLIDKSRHLSLAREIAAKVIEDKRAITYDDLAPGTTEISDSRISLLPIGSGTLLVEECDPLTHLEYCPNDEELKIFTVTINWVHHGKDQSFTMKTLISEGGLNQ